MEDSPAKPLVPIDAATVVVLRDAQPAAVPGHGFDPAASDAGAHLEVLMLRRNSRGFFGGMWVFPGGRVDPPDRDAPGDVVAPCDPRTAGADDLHDGDRRGFHTAAVREAHEEAGIDLSGAELTHFAHWLPPPIRPKRFSTHFFVCEAPADLDAVRGRRKRDPRPCLGVTCGGVGSVEQPARLSSSRPRS